MTNRRLHGYPDKFVITKRERVKQMNLMMASCTDEALDALTPEVLVARYGIGLDRAKSEIRGARAHRGRGRSTG